MNIYLAEMNEDLAHKYFKGYIVDPALFIDTQEYKPYVYQQEKVNETLARYRELGRIYLAVMLDDQPIGEIVFKNIDHSNKHCTLGISLQCDDVKNNEMGMITVFADAIIKNTRSQHVLKKVGFWETHHDDSFIYYRCDKTSWNSPIAFKYAT